VDSSPYDDSIVIPSAFNVLLGVWLACSPFVLGLAVDSIANQVICGAVIAVLAYLRAARSARTAWLSWANAALGAWLFAWALLAQPGAPIATNVAISGGLVVVFGATSALTARD